MDMRTVEVGIAGFSTLYATDWPHQMAAAVIVLAPIVLVFFLRKVCCTRNHLYGTEGMTGKPCFLDCHPGESCALLSGIPRLVAVQEGMRSRPFPVERGPISCSRGPPDPARRSQSRQADRHHRHRRRNLRGMGLSLKLFRNCEFSFFTGEFDEPIRAHVTSSGSST